MKENKIKVLILLAVIVCVVIILIILSVVLKDYKQSKGTNGSASNSEENNDNLLDYYTETVNNKISNATYFDINKCMKVYFSALNININEYYGSEVFSEDDIKQRMLDLLSKKYIEKNNITKNNVYDYVKIKEDVSLFVPLEIAVMQDKDIKSFAVHGLVESIDDFSVMEETYLILNVDPVNETFSVEPLLNKKYNTIKEIKIEKYEEEIVKNENNFFTRSSSPSYEDIARNYIDLYKRLALGAPNIAYEKLDKEYREKRFGDVESFKKYVQENESKILSAVLSKYQVDLEDEYTQYVSLDENNNYYIIREYGTLDYSIILDTYTIDIPEFTEKYEGSTEQEKVILNLNKFMLALNAKDYKYAYGVLADGFKQNYFKTEEEFENYAKENFFELNNFKYNKFKKEADTYYTYDVTITEKNSNSLNQIEKSFIMLLEDGTDFKLSFNV